MSDTCLLDKSVGIRCGLLAQNGAMSDPDALNAQKFPGFVSNLTVGYSQQKLDALCRLDADCFAAQFRFDAQEMRSLATAAGAIVVMAESSDEIIGFSIVHLKKSRKTSGGYVVTLDVAEGWRRRGVARRLMGEVERQAQMAGATWMTLHVFMGNPGAIAFYESSGYVQGATVRDFYGSSMDALVFSKPLGGLREESVLKPEGQVSKSPSK